MSIETRQSWTIATVALCTLAVSFGSPYVSIVSLKAIAAEVGGQRSIPALANSLAWFGAAVGGIAMGTLAERIGVRWTAALGGTMIALGLMLSSLGEIWQLYLGHGLFIGLLGNAGINAPLYIYVTKWFDRRRGTALALISSGQYIAGALWPPLFERAVATVGWRQTMLGYGILEGLIVVPLALFFFTRPPADTSTTPTTATGTARPDDRVLGLRPNVAFTLLAAANFLCCVPMSMPTAHLIAYCGDLGLTAAKGAAMLSLLLVCAVISRQLWGRLSDSIGGLRTILLSGLAQLFALTALALAHSEASLFTVAAIFGLGYAGLIPSYVLAIREHFPAHEMRWRVPSTLLFGGSGMAFGGWLAGAIYDHAGYYTPAFVTGIAFNALNVMISGFLVWRLSRSIGGAGRLAPAV